MRHHHWEEIKDNRKLRDNIIRRDLIIRKIREWFYKQGFVEVETPSLVNLPGMEPYLDPFKTKLFNERGQGYDAYLITSPEYAMKKMLAAGFSKIFQICKSFRNNEPFHGLHNPEFTMLEWYRSRSDYQTLMADTETMITSIITFQFPISNEVPGSKFLKHQSRDIDMSLPWERLSVKQAFYKFCDLDLDKLLTLGSLTEAARKRGYKIESSFRYEDIFFKIFLNKIEPHLGNEKPVFLYDYPVQLGALARTKKSDPRYAERFELYIGGIEVANAFSELTDVGEQKKRLKAEQSLRRTDGKSIYDIDKDFLTALRAMPESAGIALGIDRLLMVFLDAKSIEEVISFPATAVFRDKN